MTPIQVQPAIRVCNPRRLHAFTASGMQVVMMDGSVKNVSTGVDLNILARAIVPNDGFPIGNDW